MKNNLCSSYKLSQDGIEKHASDMARNIDFKKYFFQSTIDHILAKNKRKISILDIGCCGWELSYELKTHYKDSIEVTWIDASGKMIEQAQNNFSEIQFLEANAFDLNILQTKFDVVICSSVLHELWSYYWNKNETDYNKWIQQWLNSIIKILNDRWYILIKDPVKPIDNYELLVYYSGKKFFSGNLSESDYFTRVKIFIENFPYFNKANFDIKENSFISNSVFISEIIRHTSIAICDTDHHFNDELQEWYGSWNEKQWNNYIKDNPHMRIITHKTSWNKNNHSVEFYKYFNFYFKNGYKIKNPQFLFPTHQFTILQKK